MSVNIQRPRGVNDITPDQSYQWDFIERTARGVARDFGFTEIRLPTFEHTELFLRGVGDTTDVVQKEMYTFEDKGGRSITLRPEGTASVVRAAVENSLLAAGLPLKTFYLAPMFRYEKPQAGRLREHHQFGVELLGSSEPIADAEVISLGAEYLKRLGVTNVRLEINSIGCPECRAKYRAALVEYFSAHIDSLCATCRERLQTNPLRILDCKSEACRSIAENAPVGLDYLCGDCAEHFQSVQKYLGKAGLPFTVNPRIVRGLDYYTRTVFEFISDAIGAQGTVLGGGRYDGLVETLGGAATPGLGFGSGIERMLLTLEAGGGEIPNPGGVSVYIVAAADAKSREKAAKLTHILRSKNISAEIDLMNRSLKAQMKHANRIGAKFALVIGGDELNKKRATLKPLFSGREAQITLDERSFAKEIKALLK